MKRILRGISDNNALRRASRTLDEAVSIGPASQLKDCIQGVEHHQLGSVIGNEFRYRLGGKLAQSSTFL